jgi:hypothetical protein
MAAPTMPIAMGGSNSFPRKKGLSPKIVSAILYQILCLAAVSGTWHRHTNITPSQWSAAIGAALCFHCKERHKAAGRRKLSQRTPVPPILRSAGAPSRDCIGWRAEW